ncbi:MAG: cyclic nucleotide-binding/CBS domain-containing protein [Halanaeroarchaeum sp.]
MPELTLRDVMTREYVGVSESDTVIGAVRLMREDGAQTAVVLRGQEPVGTVSAGDVLDMLVDDGDVQTDTVATIMRRSPPRLAPDAGIGDAASAMAANDADEVLVSEDDEVVGVVTTRDVALYSWELRDAVAEGEVVESDVTARESVSDESYSDQSICEACGALSRDLVNVNGQLLCPDCRSV